MTAGDELVLSTNFAKCLEEQSSALTKAQFDKLDRFVYRLDSDIISREFDFIEKEGLADKFNDEQQARKEAAATGSRR
jgi:hypothetical protein